MNIRNLQYEIAGGVIGKAVFYPTYTDVDKFCPRDDFLLSVDDIQEEIEKSSCISSFEVVD